MNKKRKFGRKREGEFDSTNDVRQLQFTVRRIESESSTGVTEVMLSCDVNDQTLYNVNHLHLIY